MKTHGHPAIHIAAKLVLGCSDSRIRAIRTALQSKMHIFSSNRISISAKCILLSLASPGDRTVRALLNQLAGYPDANTGTQGGASVAFPQSKSQGITKRIDSGCSLHRCDVLVVATRTSVFAALSNASLKVELAGDALTVSGSSKLWIPDLRKHVKHCYVSTSYMSFRHST